MNHTLAHQTAPPSTPLLKCCLEFTRERCEGFQRATLCWTERSSRRLIGACHGDLRETKVNLRMGVSAAASAGGGLPVADGG